MSLNESQAQTIKRTNEILESTDSSSYSIDSSEEDYYYRTLRANLDRATSFTSLLDLWIDEPASSSSSFLSDEYDSDGDFKMID